MTPRTLTRSAIAAAMALTFVFTPGPAAAQQDALPPAQQSGDVRFVSGGVGLDQSTAFKEAMRRYPLALQIAQRENGHNVYTADAEVRITDRAGQVVLETRTDGPFLLAELPDGRYLVEVTLEGVTQRKHVVVDAARSGRGFFLFAAN